MPIRVFRHSKQWKGKIKGNWKKRHILWNFWNNGHISELCEKVWRASYTIWREALFAREHKATTSKDKSNTYIDIDDLKIFKDFSTSDKTTFKSKTKTKDKNKTKNQTTNKNKTRKD